MPTLLQILVQVHYRGYRDVWTVLLVLGRRPGGSTCPLLRSRVVLGFSYRDLPATLPTLLLFVLSDSCAEVGHTNFSTAGAVVW